MTSHPHDQLHRSLRDLRISVTDRCNFRCGYCMPAEIFGEKYEFLPRADLLNFEEIERLVRLFADLGVEKVRITGGEPLMRHDVTSLVERIHAIPGIDDIAITTNAMLLPRWVEGLAKAGLKRITVSLDSLDEEVFLAMSGGRGNVQQVLDGIAAAETAGYENIKINCVAQKGVNDHTLVDLARYFRGTGHIVRFIEYMDVGTRNRWDLSQVLTGKEIVDLIDGEFPIECMASNYSGEVAKRWRYKDGKGEIGLITSVSQPFCGACSRARLTTEGRLVTCLFASSGIDLRGPMRAGVSDDELRERIAGRWLARRDRYSEERADGTAPDEEHDARTRLEMYQLGG